LIIYVDDFFCNWKSHWKDFTAKRTTQV
jgi:hypothetical protein